MGRRTSTREPNDPIRGESQPPPSGSRFFKGWPRREAEDSRYYVGDDSSSSSKHHHRDGYTSARRQSARVSRPVSPLRGDPSWSNSKKSHEGFERSPMSPNFETSRYTVTVEDRSGSPSWTWPQSKINTKPVPPSFRPIKRDSTASAREVYPGGAKTPAPRWDADFGPPQGSASTKSCTIEGSTMEILPPTWQYSYDPEFHRITIQASLATYFRNNRKQLVILEPQVADVKDWITQERSDNSVYRSSRRSRGTMKDFAADCAAHAQKSWESYRSSPHSSTLSIQTFPCNPPETRRQGFNLLDRTRKDARVDLRVAGLPYEFVNDKNVH